MKKTNTLIIVKLFLLLLMHFSMGIKAQNTALPNLSLPDPLQYEAFYDIASGKYFVYPKIGNTRVGAPIIMTVKEYADYMQAKNARNYYKNKSNENNIATYKDATTTDGKKLLPSITIKNKLFESIFGGNKIELTPQGFASFDIGGLYQKIENPLVLPQNRSSFAINIQQRIQLGILGKVGENLQLKANYDTQSGFAFENRMNLIWQNKGTWQDLQSKGISNKETGEDKIIKRVEFGNVNMPLSTNLIQGSQSLFGLKTEFKLGKTIGTAVFSQQQGESKNIVVQGGGVLNTFKISAVDYEENQHYYLGQYFYNNYDSALLNYPLINSKINITRIELWKIDQGSGDFQNQKSILAIRDLSEGISGYPNNSQNNLYQSINALGSGIRDVNTAYNAINNQSFNNPNGTPETYIDGEHFVFNRRVRRLASNEFSYNPQLGTVSLNQKLNDNQLLAVAFTFTVNGSNQVYKVGEFSEESNTVVLTKLLKPNVSVKTGSSMWKLMMKNVYSLDANQIERENFVLNVNYRHPANGKVNYLPNTNVQDKTLLQVMNWDRLNQNNDLQNNSGSTGDGVFDFVQGLTIDATNGKLMFTKAEPFGSNLRNVLGSNDPNYVFESLYTQLKQVASQDNLAQRYTIDGRYRGNQGDGIPLGAINIPQGSVRVTANGALLVEGQDYTVDYLLGRLKIINESVKNSGQAINISLENQLTFNNQRKRFLGLNLERKFNEKLMLGATIINYSETPLTQKVQIGNEAVNNTMFGMNMQYNSESPFLTRLTDKIPFINSEAISNINFRAEAAYLLPGQNSGTNDQSYIDDFEQSTSKISLKEPNAWALASKPEKNLNDPVFSNGLTNDNVAHGNGRGLLTWYYIDPRFYGTGGNAPTGITSQSVSNHASRRVQTIELFNQRDLVAGEQTLLNTLDISYFPAEKGPYNVNPAAETTQQRWAGLMRPVSVSNFVQSNIEYVEFWLQDPYADGTSLGADPKLLLHLGNVSEDILKDGKLQYENGLPTTTVPSQITTTNWGNQPKQYPVLYSFASEGDDRRKQDVGYDGLNNSEEQAKFNISQINPITQQNDPASDDFVFYMSNQFTGLNAASLTNRYKYFRNPDGNSNSGTLDVANQTPDAEDLNRDYNLDQSEDYNQYSIGLKQSDLVLGQNFIVDKKTVNVTFKNGQNSQANWFLFRIPVNQYDNTAGSHDPAILNNVRFMRMLVKGFDDASTLRFASLDLVRSDWRRYGKNIANFPGESEGNANIDNSNFEVGSVNLEENSLGTPPYVLPPGIDRQVLSGNAGIQRQNEASLYMKAKSLVGSRGVFKNTALDMRRFKNMELFVHAQNLRNPSSNAIDDDAKFFIRLGSDASDNYYEYEISLKYTDKNAKSPSDIWPNENMIRLQIQDFINAKLKRDALGTAIDERFKDPLLNDPHKAIYTRGRPSLGNITTIVMGIRNTNEVSKDLTLWVNELRLTGVENEGGYAANASLNFNLSDFAQINTNFSHSSIGFGGIDQKPVQRNQTTNTAFGINTNVNLDKFLPENTGIKIPFTYSYAQKIEDPKYNPLDTDVVFKNAINKEKIQQIVRTFAQQRSVGVVNMRKERVNTKKKNRFYDIENLSTTLLYNDDYYRDIYTKKNFRQNLKGFIDYNYSFKAFVIRPFEKVISDTAKIAKYMQWFKEFNLNLMPTRLSFRTELDRNYSELEYRNIEAILAGNSGFDFASIRNRNFFFGWQYNLGFNLTQSFKIDIQSNTRTLNDNLNVNTMDNSSIFQNPFRAGRPVNYSHKVQLNYQLPFEKFPLIDFITAEMSYGFQYDWNARSTALLISPDGNLGNIAQNTNIKTFAATADVNKFFKKFKYFQKIDKIQQKRKSEIDSLNQVYAKNVLENRSGGYKFYKFRNKLKPLQALAYALTSIKQINLDATENNGMMLPGFLPVPNFFGYGQNSGGPNFGFLMGSQADVRRLVIENSWLSNSELMNDPFTRVTTRNINASAQILPINDLKIDINFLQTYQRNFTQGGYNVDANKLTPEFDFSFGNDLVTYSHSDLTLSTSRINSDVLFQNMRDIAKSISRKQAGLIDANGYTQGYSLANAYVLVPAFEAAIKGKTSADLVDTPTKARLPLPNWRIVYSGLKNIPIVSSQFTRFDVLHSYTSTYTTAGIQSNIDYYSNQSPTDVNGSIVNPYIYSQVGFVESFSPLIGIDFTMRNNIQVKAMYNKNRAFLLGLKNFSLSEESGNEIILGLGYLKKDVKMKLQFKGKNIDIKSDLNIRADVSIRDNQTKIINLLQNESQVTGGQRIVAIKFSADYNLSKNFNVKLFYDQMMTKYKISTAFPLSTIRAGLTATFTFGGN